MEGSSEEDYHFDKLLLFLQQKIQIMPPSDPSKPLCPLQKIKLPRLEQSPSLNSTLRHSHHSPTLDRDSISLGRNFITNMASRGNLYGGGMVSAK